MSFDAEQEQTTLEAKIKDLELRIAPMQKELKEMRERYSLLTKIINRAKTT